MSEASLTCILLLIFFVSTGYAQIGMAFSPFVSNGDDPSSARYARNHVEVMLKLVEEMGYREISTYGVGAPAENYIRDHTWKRCASSVHAALAAAEINQEKRTLSLSVYQGLFISTQTSDTHANSEMEVGFEVSSMANEIHPGTVKGMIFPSAANVDSITDARIFNLMEGASARSKSMNLLFGARFWDCPTLIHRKDNVNIKRLLKNMDFIICQVIPTEDEVRVGQESFLNRVLQIVSSTSEVVRSIEPNAFVTIMLETGWPGGEELGIPNTEIFDLIQFWNRVEKARGNLQVFMHEAFDNPWKRENLGSKFGRWRHTKANDFTKYAYELKKGAPPKPNSGNQLSKELIIGIVFGLALFIVLTMMIILGYRRVSRRIKTGSKLTEQEIRQFLDGIVTNEVVDDENGGDKWKMVPYNRDFELIKNKFTIDKNCNLGSGAFGYVYKGKIDGLVNEVAFKMAREDCPLSALRGLLSEIKILTYLGKHENIVSICGAYTAELTSGVVYLATELCTYGSLEKYLRGNRQEYINTGQNRYVTSLIQNSGGEINDANLLKWSLEIASAMEYINSRNVIHADLATRNVLLTSNLTAKVTDFGLSRRLYEYTEYVKKQQEPLPWRWMSIESLRKLEFSTKSDVWSYGVTLWEIYSLGDLPYPGLSWTVDFVNQLESGLRMQIPTRATSNLYEIMVVCWHTDPQCRPSFKEIKDTLLSIHAHQNNRTA